VRGREKRRKEKIELLSLVAEQLICKRKEKIKKNRYNVAVDRGEKGEVVMNLMIE